MDRAEVHERDLMAPFPSRHAYRRAIFYRAPRAESQAAMHEGATRGEPECHVRVA